MSDLHRKARRTRGVPRGSSPDCIGIIMDGNRRWAKRNGLPATKGHQRGYEKLESLWQWANEERVSCLIVYAFSTENWNRSQEEVAALMKLFRTFFRKQINRATKHNIQIRFIGDRSHLPKDVQVGMSRIERETKPNTGLRLVVAAPYGSRHELVSAVKRISESGVSSDQITETTINDHLETADIPDPDLIIRTGGRKRLSNFLLWQAAYSELTFTDTLWPDFSKREFTKTLYDYALRKRTHGK